MPNLFEKAIVEKRNVLNELRANNFTLQELRLFSIYLSRINPYDKSTRIVEFKLSDFQKIMDFKKLKLSQLQATTDRLLIKLVRIPLESGGYNSFQLFKNCKIDKNNSGEWCVYINAHDDALPLMFDFKDRYFKYELWNALQLKSANQIRMYEILKQYENIGKRELSISELRELLGIAPSEYPRWDRFKDRVLDSCQKALKQYTDICYTYEKGKSGKGGKWLTIVFHIKKNKAYKETTSISEFITEEYEPIERKTEQQLEFYDTQQNDDIDFFSSACDREFTTNQIESFLPIINTMTLPPHPNGTTFAKFHYLLEVYTRFKAIAEQSPISNRYGYFYKMLCSDRERKADAL